jgi:integrase
MVNKMTKTTKTNFYFDKHTGKYYFVANLGYDSWGKRVQKKRRGFRTLKEAKEVYADLVANYNPSSVAEIENIKFKAFYKRYFLPWYKTGVADKTYSRAKNCMKRAVKFFGDMKVKEIRPIHIQGFHQYLLHECVNEGQKSKDKPLSPNYIKQIFNKLRVVFKRAMVLEILSDNPVDTIGRIQTVKTKIQFWTDEEFQTVYQHSSKSDFTESFYKMLMRFLFVTGMRSEEFFALQWSDIDFDNKLADINKAIDFKKRSDWKFTKPKNESSVRKVALDDSTVEELKQWKENQKLIGNIDFVFSFDGLPVCSKTLAQRIKKNAEAVGVKPINLHAMRHSHVAFLINKNVNIYLISKRLGHSSVKTTLDKYGHLYPDANREMLGHFDQFIIKIA